MGGTTATAAATAGGVELINLCKARRRLYCLKIARERRAVQGLCRRLGVRFYFGRGVK